MAEENLFRFGQGHLLFRMNPPLKAVVASERQGRALVYSGLLLSPPASADAQPPRSTGILPARITSGISAASIAWVSPWTQSGPASWLTTS